MIGSAIESDSDSGSGDFGQTEHQHQRQPQHLHHHRHNQGVISDGSGSDAFDGSDDGDRLRRGEVDRTNAAAAAAAAAADLNASGSTFSGIDDSMSLSGSLNNTGNTPHRTTYNHRDDSPVHAGGDGAYTAMAEVVDSVHAAAARATIGLDTDTEGEEEEKRRFFARVADETRGSGFSTTSASGGARNPVDTTPGSSSSSSSTARVATVIDNSIGHAQPSPAGGGGGSGAAGYNAIVSSPAPALAGSGRALGAAVSSHSPIEPAAAAAAHNSESLTPAAMGPLSRLQGATLQSPHPETTFDISGLNGSGTSPPSTAGGGTTGDGRDTARTASETDVRGEG
jgi:hypothetical protein